MRRIILILTTALCFHAFHLDAQNVSISTNLIDYASLGTLNLETSYAVSQHWSVTASARYNPFTFNKGEAGKQFQYRQQSYALGARFWPWHTLSGWWFASKVRWQEYNFGGLFSKRTEEGDRIGAGIYSGYTHMLGPHFNIEFGGGFWTGVAVYTEYDCPRCGLTKDSGVKYFLLPDDFSISLVYVF
jgi:hypothetical protein